MMRLALYGLATAIAMPSVATLAQPLPGSVGSPSMLSVTVTGEFCIQGNLIYSLGGITCVGDTGLVCVPSVQAEGKFAGPAYWSSERKRFGEIEFKPPTSCKAP